MAKLFFGLLCCGFFFATGPLFAQQNYHLAYQLDAPSGTFYMPKILNEISGLSETPDGKRLLAIQDEDGILFSLDKQTGKILDQFNFWEDGDYEGVEMVGQDVYVVKSTGTLYRVRHLGQPDQTTEKFNDYLDKENDVEGLAYDPATTSLLLACKKKAGVGETYTHTKAVYAFNLKTDQLESKPRFLIQWSAVLDYLAAHPEIRRYDKVCEFFAKEKDDFDLSPSGLAIHPVTGHLYLLSSVGKLLIIVNRTGTILHIEKLEKEIHAQPEGISFAKDGTLYIANEKRDDTAVIHWFRYQP